MFGHRSRVSLVWEIGVSKTHFRCAFERSTFEQKREKERRTILVTHRNENAIVAWNICMYCLWIPRGQWTLKREQRKKTRKVSRCRYSLVSYPLGSVFGLTCKIQRMFAIKYLLKTLIEISLEYFSISLSSLDENDYSHDLSLCHE